MEIKDFLVMGTELAAAKSIELREKYSTSTECSSSSFWLVTCSIIERGGELTCHNT
jgi:hypothetical protein